MVVVIVPSIVVVVVPLDSFLCCVAVDADEEAEGEEAEEAEEGGEAEEGEEAEEEDEDEEDDDDGGNSLFCMQSSVHMDVKYCRANSICSANNRQTLTLK